MIPKTLAIDYGTVRIGLAVSYGTLAEPYIILENNESMYDQIVSICKEEYIKQIVIGVSENVMAEQTKVFAQELQKHISIPLFFTDETLSSHTVHEQLKTAKKKVRTGNIDHFAAAHFLQEWIEEQN